MIGVSWIGGVCGRQLIEAAWLGHRPVLNAAVTAIAGVVEKNQTQEGTRT